MEKYTTNSCHYSWIKCSNGAVLGRVYSLALSVLRIYTAKNKCVFSNNFNAYPSLTTTAFKHRIAGCVLARPLIVLCIRRSGLNYKPITKYDSLSF